MEWTKLNVFQRLTRKWDAHHPYNAAQAMKLGGAADVERLSQTWRATLDALGLGRVRIAGDSFRHEILNGSSRHCGGAQLIVAPADQSFDAFITDNLNRPFDDAFPLRPFVIPSDDGHFIGVAYHHWVADSASIRLLLREWFFRTHHPERAREHRLVFPRDGYAQHFGPARGGWSYFDAGVHGLRWGMRLRHARRVEIDPVKAGFATHFQLHHLPDGIVERLLPIARAAGATLNDLFLAAAAQVCDALVPVKRTPRRTELAMGTIVDLRSRAGNDALHDAFGLFLGFTTVVCKAASLRDRSKLLHEIASQNALHKRTSGPESSMLRMATALAMHRIYSQKRILNWYRKRIPVAAGISNVNLNRDWPREFHPAEILDYVRVSPLGPMMPVVFTTTTLGRNLNFGLTCRESVIPRILATRIAETFQLRLEEIARTGT